MGEDGLTTPKSPLKVAQSKMAKCKTPAVLIHCPEDNENAPWSSFIPPQQSDPHLGHKTAALLTVTLAAFAMNDPVITPIVEIIAMGTVIIWLMSNHP